jgi:hypothetical protein
MRHLQDGNAIITADTKHQEQDEFVMNLLNLDIKTSQNEESATCDDILENNSQTELSAGKVPKNKAQSTKRSAKR